MVEMEIEEGIATMTLRNPPDNALTMSLLRQQKEKIEKFGVNDNVKVVILQGENVFTAGANMVDIVVYDSQKGVNFFAWFMRLF